MVMLVGDKRFNIVGVSRADRDFHIATDENNVDDILSAVGSGDVVHVGIKPKDMPNLTKMYELIYRSVQYDIDDKNIACQISFFMVKEVQ